MIFHFLNDLQTQFPTYTFYAEGMTNEQNQGHILVKEQGGAADGYPSNKIDASVQVSVREQDQFTCKQKADAVFDYMRYRNNVTLVAHPDDDSGTASIFIRMIKAVQSPYPGGRLADGNFVYVNNYVLTYQLPVT